MPFRVRAMPRGPKGCLSMPSIGAERKMRSNIIAVAQPCEQRNEPAHRMGDQIERRRTVGQHDIGVEGLEVGPVIFEIVDMAEATVADQPVGSALPAKIESGHREAALLEIGDRLEIFLDVLSAALQQADRALGRPRSLGKGRVAETHAIGCYHPAGPRPFWDRIGVVIGELRAAGIDDGVHALSPSGFSDARERWV